MSNPRNISYVVGFLFSSAWEDGVPRVALVTKSKPEWQKGKLNGVGGKIEHGESGFEAMFREFCEETGTCPVGWRKFCTLYCPGARVVFFTAWTSVEIPFTSLPDEPVRWYKLSDLQTLPVLPNLRWLIPMALDENAPLAVIHEK